MTIATPPSQHSNEEATPSYTAILLAAAAGWALLKLVSGGGRVPAPVQGSHRQRTESAEETVRASASERHAPVSAASEPGRGRQADTPTEIPVKGWKDILWRTYEEFSADRVMSIAAGVTYYALLALFPALAALVSLYGLFADPATIRDHLVTLSNILPSGAIDIIGEQVSRIASTGEDTLGVSFVIGLGVSLWSANAGMKAFLDALNVVYDEDEKRGFIALNLRSLAFTLGAVVFILVALAGIVVVPVVLAFVGLASSTEWLLAIARWPILLTGVTLGLAVVYRYGPSRDQAKWKWVTPGSIVAAVLWLAVSMLFSWYAANFGSYNETYGSLGAVIGFMTWIWISSVVVLLGAEINAEMEHQTAKDTTEGSHQPMGARGAQMADTVGVAKS
jgi:membrane protein